MSSRLNWFPALISAFCLCAVLGWMISGRAAILRDGVEVVLKTEPVDPRDLLRGQYVRLNYSISTLSSEMLRLQDGDTLEAGESVYVRLVRGEQGYHEAVSVMLGVPPSGRNEGEIWIRGKLSYGVVPESINARVEYGIERFYASEASAPEIEARMRDGDVTEAVVAVAADGRAQIKALRQPTGTIYTEPLF